MPKKTPSPPHRSRHTLMIVRGKGTAREQRIETTIPLYWSPGLQRWVTIPRDDQERT